MQSMDSGSPRLCPVEMSLQFLRVLEASAMLSFGYVELDPDGVTTLRIDSALKALLARRLGYAGGLMEVRKRLVVFASDLLIAIENVQGR